MTTQESKLKQAIALGKKLKKSLETNSVSYHFQLDSDEYVVRYKPYEEKGNYKLIIGKNGDVIGSTTIFSYQLSISQAKDDLIRYYLSQQ